MVEGWRVKIMIFFIFYFWKLYVFYVFFTLKNNSGGWMFAFKNVFWKNTLLYSYWTVR